VFLLNSLSAWLLKDLHFTPSFENAMSDFNNCCCFVFVRVNRIRLMCLEIFQKVLDMAGGPGEILFDTLNFYMPARTCKTEFCTCTQLKSSKSGDGQWSFFTSALPHTPSLPPPSRPRPPSSTILPYLIVVLCLQSFGGSGNPGGGETGDAAPDMKARLLTISKEIVPYHMAHNAEAEACDLLMEIEHLDLLSDYVDELAYPRVCLYLKRWVSCFSL
jgi:hypothetical protein